MARLRLLPSAFAAVLIFGAGLVRAEVKKFAIDCGGRICPYYQLVLTPPDGWVIEKSATDRNKLQIMVPKGTDFGTAPALIYVQVFYHTNKQQTLADFARVSNERWLATVKDAKISELPAVNRANAKPGFLRFAFENPGNKQQAYEVGSFGIDSDMDGNEFVLDVVMSGADKAALDHADKDYVAFLKAN
jgi:hypothetical protein